MVKPKESVEKEDAQLIQIAQVTCIVLLTYFAISFSHGNEVNHE